LVCLKHIDVVNNTVEQDPLASFLSSLTQKMRVESEHSVMMEKLNNPDTPINTNINPLEIALAKLQGKVAQVTIPKAIEEKSIPVVDVTLEDDSVEPLEEESFVNFIDKLKDIIVNPPVKKPIEKIITIQGTVPESVIEPVSPVPKVKVTTPNAYIEQLDKNNAKPVIVDSNDYTKELDKLSTSIAGEHSPEKLSQITKLLEEYIDKRLKKVAVMAEYAGGGGSVAVQYAKGGTMDGDLNVTGQYLSAGVNINTLFGTGGGQGDAAVDSLVRTNSGNWDTAYNVSTSYQNISGSFATNTLLRSTSALLTPLSITNDLTGSLVTNTAFNNYQTNIAASTATLLPISVYQSNSGSFATLDFVSNNFFNLTGGIISGATRINNNLTVFGNLTATGTTTFANTVFSVTSALSVIHIGSGPAMYIGNSGDGDIASFYDLDQGIEVFHVGGNNGSFPNVGVKTSTPNVDFTVNGQISANNTIWSANGNSNNWNSAYASTTALNLSSGNWNSTFTTLCANSATWVKFQPLVYNTDNVSDVYVNGVRFPVSNPGIVYVYVPPGSLGLYIERKDKGEGTRWYYGEYNNGDDGYYDFLSSNNDAAYPWLASWTGIAILKAPSVDRILPKPLSAADPFGSTLYFEGSSIYAAKADHSHVYPTPVQIGAAPTVHTHTICQVTNLQTCLNAIEVYTNPTSFAIRPVAGFNTSSGYWSNVAGGKCNTASGSYANVAGGVNNTASGRYSNVAGGQNNTASGFYDYGNETYVGGWSTIGGGNGNTTCNSIFSVIAGGVGNIASGTQSSVGGGNSNTASGYYSNVAGGRLNTASGVGSNVAGGFLNRALSAFSNVVGGNCNTASGVYANIIGGLGNYNPLRDSIIGGGVANHTGGFAPFNITAAASISGNGSQTRLTGTGIQNCFSSPFASNNVSVYYSTPTVPLSSGCFTTATIAATGTNFIVINSDYSTCTPSGLSATSIYVYDRAINIGSDYGNVIGGGKLNTASSCYNFVGGGCCNSVAGVRNNAIVGGSCNVNIGPGNASIVGGQSNLINTSGNYAAIAGGRSNTVSNWYSSIGGGSFNSIGGQNSVVAGGSSNVANQNGVAIAGGCGNTAAGLISNIGGGRCNIITGSGVYSSIGSGRFNYNPTYNSNIQGGSFNHTGGFTPANITFGANLSGNGACTALIATGIGSCFSASGTTGAVSLMWMTSGTANSTLSSACFGTANVVTNAANCIIINGDYSTCRTGASACSIYVYDRCVNIGRCFNFIGGGVLNTASGNYSLVAGGALNSNTGNCASVVGGFRNIICTTNTGFSFIGGGCDNRVGNSGAYSVIGGGYNNCTCSSYNVIAGGHSNTNGGNQSVIIGGRFNLICTGGQVATIGGGYSNALNACSTTIAGGCSNSITSTAACYSTIGGGNGNLICTFNSGIFSGRYNKTQGYTPVLVTNTSNISGSGGKFTLFNLGADYSQEFSNVGALGSVTIGFTTTANRSLSTLTFDNGNITAKTTTGGSTCLLIQSNSNDFSTCTPTSVSATSVWLMDRCVNANRCSSVIGGGIFNTASGNYSSLLGGAINTASGTYSSVVGGRCNTASGNYSFVASGSANNTRGFANTFILGSSLSASKANYTYVNNLSVQGNIESNTNYVVTLSLTANQTANNAADTTVALDPINDPNNWFNRSTRRLTPTVPGYYHVDYQVAWVGGTAGSGNQNNIQIRRNATSVALAQQPISDSNVNTTQNTADIAFLNGTTDYLEFTAYSSNAAQSIIGTSDGAWTKVEIFKIN